MPAEDTGTFRATGTIANSANTGTIEGSKSLSSAGSGTTDDYLIGKCSACALRGQQSTKWMGNVLVVTWADFDKVSWVLRLTEYTQIVIRSIY